MRMLKIIQSAVAIIGVFMVLMVVLVIGNNAWRKKKVDTISRQYINKTYDFSYSIDSIQYDYVMDNCRVEIAPDVQYKEPRFTLLLSAYGGQWHVVSDTFLQQKVSEWLYQEWNDKVKALWGDDAKLGISINSPELCNLQTINRNDYKIDDLLNCTFDRQILVISLEKTSITDLPADTVLETIKVIRKTSPKWDCLIMVSNDTYTGDETNVQTVLPGVRFEPLSDFKTEEDIVDMKIFSSGVDLRNFQLR